MAIEYDSSSGIVVSAFRFKSTIIPMVVDGPEFWLFLILNIFICVMRHMGLFNPEIFHLDLPWDLTGTTGSLMTFFVVFYNSHVFGRYTKLYTLTKTMLECAVKVAAMLRVCIPDERIHWKICKYVMASILIFLFERTQGDEADPISKIEWDQLLALDLLTEEEIENLQQHCISLHQCDSAYPSFFPIQWSMELLRHVTEEPLDRDDMLSSFYGTIYKVWDCQARIKETLELPMPFPYFHIMNLMLMLNLFLWAYSLGCQDSFWAPIIYMFVQMMFQGIRELSTALSDPFGSDDVDFPINEWMMTLYARVYGILEDTHDLKKCDLSKVQPMMDPRQARGLIKMYVDLDVEVPSAAASGGQGYSSLPQEDEEFMEEEGSVVLSEDE